ncbi:MAG: hypothetical protein WAT41_00025, partial [Flavobacteriales bacterium]
DGLPVVELAHYAVEQELHLDQGYFGLINDGHAIAKLRGPEVDRTLLPDLFEAQVLACTLQAVSNGTVAQQDYLSTAEVRLPRAPKGITTEVVIRMLNTYITLLNSWEQVADGSALELRWR